MKINSYILICLNLFLAVECEKPPEGVNTEAVPENVTTTFSSLFIYQCLEGYTTLDHLGTTCNSSGNWTKPSPKCHGKILSFYFKYISNTYRSCSSCITIIHFYNLFVVLVFVFNNRILQQDVRFLHLPS